MTDVIQPVDAAERERVERTGLSETLFVEAGAGTGKTHELVQRVVHLVTDAAVPLSAIAAITFTEAAAAELRDRIREALERRLAVGPDGFEAAACRQALTEIDEAAIGTLHGFALRILSEHPLEVGLPPRVEVLDEVSSQLAFEARWERFVDELFADPDAESLILHAWALGVEVDTRSQYKASFKDVAGIFESNWDLLDAIAEDEVRPLAPVDYRDLAAAAAGARAVAAGCLAEGDLLLGKITAACALVEAAVAASNPLVALKTLADHRWKWTYIRSGRAGNWPDVETARQALAEVGRAADAVHVRVSDEVLQRLSIHLARFTRDAADARRAEGRLDFHDLLVLARRLVRTSAPARAALHERYQRLLLDEFQDTDPIQIEVAVLIAAAVDDGVGLEAQPWDEVRTDEGRLFFVGDPKQSIYRFRRANIGLFLDARAAFAAGGPVLLSQNFRTVGPVLDWVNHVFGDLMATDEPGAQARYQPLAAHRTDGPADHRVVLLGGPMDGKAGELRAAEAAAVADAVASVRDEPGAWPVFDQGTKAWRAPTMKDVTILVPTRTSLRQLEDALDARQIPYRVATGSLVYDTQEVREVLSALRAVDDPGDTIALVSALRSPLYACSDVDLFTWKQAGGHFDLRRPAPAGVDDDHPVARALAQLHSLWEVRWWHETSALLERLLRERQAFALAFSHRRPREVWRRLRFIVDQARAFEEAGGGGLRAFLDWADLQRSEGSRVHEPLVADTDDVAVSILTIHGAKGLEFPITVLSGATTQLRGGRKGVQVLWEHGRPAVRVKKEVVSENFDRLADLEAEMDEHERKRLLYVACTRARDHLIVSTFHCAGKASYGEWLHRLSGDGESVLCRRLPARLPLDVPVTLLRTSSSASSSSSAAAGASVTDDRDEWIARRDALLETQRQPRFLSATAIATAADGDGHGTDDDADGDDEFDGDEPPVAEDGEQPAIPWRRGRAGTAIGRAVHATLQFLDGSEDDARLVELAAQHAHLEAVPDAIDTVVALTRSALRAPSVQAASTAPRVWRELYVAAPLGDRAIEGYVDLLYETGDGLVLVDYKTDSVRSEAEADAKTARYGVQTAAYALALEASTGITVTEARLVFCTTKGPIERTIEDLPAAKDEVRRRVAAPTR